MPPELRQKIADAYLKMREAAQLCLESSTDLYDFRIMARDAYVQTALDVTRDNQSKAARMARCHRNTMTRLRREARENEPR